MKRGRKTLPLILGMLCATAGLAWAEPGDEAVEMALRGAILGHAAMVRSAAEMEGAAEVADEIAALAAVVETPLPTVEEWNKRTKGFDPKSRTMTEMLRRQEPRQRYIEARKDREYEERRRKTEAFGMPLAGAAQGNFSALIFFPITILDSLSVGTEYLNVQQRKELVHARRVPEEANVVDSEVLAEWPARRQKLAALQAEKNAEWALQEGRLLAAEYWLSREKLHQENSDPGSETRKEFAERRQKLGLARKASTAIAQGTGEETSTWEFADYARLLRLYFQPDAREQFEEAAAKFLAEYPTSNLLDDIEGARAAAARRNGDTATMEVSLRALEFFEDSPWTERAPELMAVTGIDPEAALDYAQTLVNNRKARFVSTGEDPNWTGRFFTGEQARQRARSGFQRARALFFTDVIARSLFYPLTKFPKKEILDAAAQAPPAYFETPKARPWLKKIAAAQMDEKRYTDAAKSYEMLGNESAAERARKAAARALEKEGDAARTPDAAAISYERLLNAYPDYRYRTRVETKLAERQEQRDVLVRLTREELRTWPEVAEALGISPVLLDGKRTNGELTKMGAALLRSDAVAYQDEVAGHRLELPLEPETRINAMRLILLRKKSEAVAKELARPRTRKHVPLQVDVGMMPGFDVAPGLVPLEEDMRERDLFE